MKTSLGTGLFQSCMRHPTNMLCNLCVRMHCNILSDVILALEFVFLLREGLIQLKISQVFNLVLESFKKTYELFSILENKNSK